MRLNKEEIRKLIQEPYFSRGEKYFKGGMIKIIAMSEDSVKARAVGSCVYNIKLTIKSSKLNGTCSCPAFYDYGPCKHMAAVGLAAIEYVRGKFYKLNEKYVDQVDEFESFEKFLNGKTKKELVGLIVEMSGLYPEIIADFYE